MNKQKILFISDMNPLGSGYKTIVTELGNGLVSLGYKVICLGLGYNGTEHWNKFTLIPTRNIQEIEVMAGNLKNLKEIELAIIALDIPMQEKLLPLFKKMKIKTIVITPLESGPLCFTWSYALSLANKVFFISQLGADEAQKVGLDAEHLHIGVDSVSWRLRTTDEYNKGREMMNISPDTFVVLTVADNQERKNLSKSFEIVGKLKKEKEIKVKYILVSREFSPIGWKLRDLAMRYGIASELMLFERGLDFKKLYALYAVSDAYLSTSKAEGLGLPVLEAMAVGIPVVATNTGALTEVLADDRGFLMDTEYTFCDPWGNADRHIPSAESGAVHLATIYEFMKMMNKIPIEVTRNARKYIETLTWDIPIKQLDEAMEKLNESEI